MKFVILISLCLWSKFFFAQTSLIDSTKLLTKIRFIDDQNINYDGGYGLAYEMKQNEKGEWNLVQTLEYEFSRGGYASNLKKKYRNKKRKMIGVISNSLVKQLVNSVDTGMTKMNIDSLWYTSDDLNTNSNKMAKSSYHWRELNLKERQYFETQIKDKWAVDFILGTYYMGSMTTDYPTFGVQLIYGDDTIHIHSHEQEALMLPWTIWTSKDTLKTFNPQIPLTIAQMLPEHKRSNVVRLQKESLDKLVANQIYDDYCRDHFAEEKSKKKFTATLTEISKNFVIVSSEEQNMSSLDWEGDNSVLRCELKDSAHRQNIFYDLKLEIIDKVPFSAESIIKKSKDIKLRLNKLSFLIDLIEKDSIESIKIHFTNDQSFSVKARKGFVRDAGNNLYEKYKSDMGDAVLMTISHKGGYGRYLLLDSGNLILWHYSGKIPPLGYTSEQLGARKGLFKNSFAMFSPSGQLMVME